MERETLYNVQAVGPNGTALYLSLSMIDLKTMSWTTDAEKAFEYSDRMNAEAEAAEYGGEVFKFTRPARRA